MHCESQEGILHQTRMSYILYCTCCGKIQLGFNNSIFIMGRREFEDLGDSLEQFDNTLIPSSQMPNGRIHVLRTGCRNAMAFTPSEIEEMKGLFQEARAALSVKELMEGS